MNQTQQAFIDGYLSKQAEPAGAGSDTKVGAPVVPPQPAAPAKPAVPSKPAAPAKPAVPPKRSPLPAVPPTGIDPNSYGRLRAGELNSESIY